MESHSPNIHHIPQILLLQVIICLGQWITIRQVTISNIWRTKVLFLNCLAYIIIFEIDSRYEFRYELPNNPRHWLTNFVISDTRCRGWILFGGHYLTINCCCLPSQFLIIYIRILILNLIPQWLRKGQTLTNIEDRIQDSTTDLIEANVFIIDQIWHQSLTSTPSKSMILTSILSIRLNTFRAQIVSKYRDIEIKNWIPARHPKSNIKRCRNDGNNPTQPPIIHGDEKWNLIAI